MRDILNIKSKLSDYKLGFVDSIDQIQSIIKQNNTITVIDSNVDKLYPSLRSPLNIVLDSYEYIKTLDGVTVLLNILKDRKTNVETTLVVIGGGILQDIVGFCASVYCRGINYILVPTTLLAQADSCVGGKTSINLDNRKNLIGTFYPPKEIIIYTKFLQTLSKLDYLSGIGELYKFHILQNKINLFNVDNDVETMILDGLKYKIDILSRDEFDKRERKFLNFGHTFGHALESTSNNNIPHGIAVIIGCMISISISKELGYYIKDYDISIKKGYQILKECNITFKPEWFNLNNLLEVIKSDKKSTGKLTMVLINNQQPILINVENIIILENVLNKIYESI